MSKIDTNEANKKWRITQSKVANYFGLCYVHNVKHDKKGSP